MSDELKLSQRLISDIFQCLNQHDSRCQNELIACQYLAAMVGHLVARQRMADRQKEEIIEELLAFIRHVVRESIVQPQPTQVPAADPEQAFGIWKPNDN